MVNEASKLAERNLAAGVCYRPALLAELGISARAFSDRLCGCLVLLATIARDVFGDDKPVSGAVLYDVAAAAPDGNPLNEFDVSEVALLLESGCFTADSAANDWSIVRRNWTRRRVIDELATIDTNDSVATLERVQQLLIDLEAERGVTPTPLETLVRDYPALRPPVIDGLLRQGETGNLIAKSKVGKSWLAYGIAISVATGRRLWGRYDCAPGRVLLVDNELHPEVLASRIPAVAAAMGLTVDDLAGRLDVVSLRGRLMGLHDVGTLVRRSRTSYRLVIVDALYRALPTGSAENSNDDITRVYNAIDAVARQTGAAFLLVHHATKGGQADKDVTDVGSGAGAQSRAVDLHLVVRPHEMDGVVVVDAAVRSFAPVERFCLAWNFPVWTPADDADPQRLKRSPSKLDERQLSKDAEGAGKIVEAIRQSGGRLTESKVRGETGMSRDRVARLLRMMERDGRVSRDVIETHGNVCREFLLADYLMTRRR